MKRITLIVTFIFITFVSLAQSTWTVPQFLGGAKNLVTVPGGFRVPNGIIMGRFVDTTAANLTSTKFYDGSIILVGTLLYQRQLSSNRWLLVGGNLPSNGLTNTLSNIKLGGALTEATSIDNSAFALNIGQNYFSNTYNFLPFADATNTMAAFQNGGTYEIFSQKTSDRVAGFGYTNSTVAINGSAKQALIGSYMPFSFGPPAPALDDSLSSFIQVVPSLVNITARQTTFNGLYANINAFTNFLPEETDSVLALPSYKRIQGMQWYDAARRTPKYWGGVRAENSNHVIFVENLQGYATDYEKIQAAINFASEGDIVLLEDNKTYNIDRGLVVPRSMVIRGGNKTVLKRENQITYTLVQAASQNDTVIRVNSIAGLHVGMPFSLAADTTYKGTTYPYYIERLAADSVYLSDSIGTTVNGNTTYPIGTKGYKSIVFMEITEATQQGSLSVTVENIIFDGNRENNRGTYLWNHNMGIVASSKGITYIKNSTFKNSPSESLLGANLNVTGTKFYNLNGSGIHLSFAASQNMGREFRSSIIGNTFDSTNKYPSFTIGGHSEGVITSSNSGAYAYIAGNVFRNALNDALFGALYGPTHSENMGTNNLTITGNIIDNVPKLVYLIDTVSGVIDNVYIKGNQINNLGTYVDYNEWLPRLQPKVIIDQYNKDTIWRSGTNVYARRNSLTYLEHTDSIGGGGGGGSIDYTTQGYGIKVDSSGRVYTVRVDSTVIGSKTYVNKVVSDSMTQLTIGVGLELTNDTLLSLKTVSSGGVGGVTQAMVDVWDNSEPDLGLPATNGYVLSSTTAGVRSWVAQSGGEEVWIISISDQTTALTTGTGKFTFRVPYGASVTSVKASLKTASSSGIPTFDINKNGTTILSTKLTIDASEKTSNTAAVSPVISVPGLDDDSEITIDIDVAGTGAIGAIIYIYHTKTGV